MSADEWDWQLASFKWLIKEFSGIAENPDNRLVLPTADFFPPTSSDPSQKAQKIFNQVKTLTGMIDWPTKLSVGEATRDTVDIPGHAIQLENHAPAGDFRMAESNHGGQVAEIRYNPKNIDKPESLIATFAHELSHYLMASAKSDPPGGWDIHELTTDLTSVYLGFGLFMANSAWNFEGHSSFDQQGWQYERQGYMTERGLVTALAIWETLAGRDPLAAVPFLKSHLAKDLKLAAKYIAKSDMLADVMAVDLKLYDEA